MRSRSSHRALILVAGVAAIGSLSLPAKAAALTAPYVDIGVDGVMHVQGASDRKNFFFVYTSIYRDYYTVRAQAGEKLDLRAPNCRRLRTPVVGSYPRRYIYPDNHASCREKRLTTDPAVAQRIELIGGSQQDQFDISDDLPEGVVQQGGGDRDTMTGGPGPDWIKAGSDSRADVIDCGGPDPADPFAPGAEVDMVDPSWEDFSEMISCEDVAFPALPEEG